MRERTDCLSTPAMCNRQPGLLAAVPNLFGGSLARHCHSPPLPSIFDEGFWRIEDNVGQKL